MGLRFRKSFSLGSLLRLNLSKSGVSVGVGPRGLNVNLGPRGIRRTIGIPGTGLYYQDSRSWETSTQTAQPSDPRVEGGTRASWIFIGLGILVAVIFAISLVGGPSTPGSKNVVNGPSKVEARPMQPPASPPPQDRPLNREEIRELQTLLRKQGFDAGTPDGLIGPKTLTAVQAFGRAHKISAPSGSTLRVLDAVRSYKK